MNSSARLLTLVFGGLALGGFVETAAIAAPTVTPVASKLAERYRITIGLRTAIVLDSKLSSQTFLSVDPYPQGVGEPEARIEILVGAGLKKSLEDRLKPLFLDHALVPTLDKALRGGESGPPELVVWPRLVEASVRDVDGNAIASLVLRVVLTSGEGVPMTTIEIAEKTDTVKQGKPESNPKKRLAQALSDLYSRALDRLAAVLPTHPLIRAIPVTPPTELKRRGAIAYDAARSCAASRGRPETDADLAFGLDDEGLRRRMEDSLARLTPDDRLAAFITGCEVDGDVAKLLALRFRRIEEKIQQGDLDGAAAVLEPLETIAPHNGGVSRARKLLADAVEARREAERRAAEAERRRVEAEERARQEAVDRAERQDRASVLATEAMKQLKAKRFDKARDAAREALALDPRSEVANEVMSAVRVHEAEQARILAEAEARRRQAELRQLQRQVPALIAKCEAAKGRWLRAEQKASDAAVNGDPDRVVILKTKQREAERDYLEARDKVAQAIAAYRREGLVEAANAIQLKARGPCGL